MTRDIQVIVHRTVKSLLLCYVDHHDKAYRWAKRRKLETHPKTGAAQLVKLRETVREIMVPAYEIQGRSNHRRHLLHSLTSQIEELLGFGVPVEWLEEVREADEDELLELAENLPSEAAEALLELATGGQPRVSHQ